MYAILFSPPREDWEGLVLALRGGMKQPTPMPPAGAGTLPADGRAALQTWTDSIPR